MNNRNRRSSLRYFTCMYCPKLVIHSSQMKLLMASSVGYIISRISGPFYKVFSLGYWYTKCQKFHVKCVPKVHFTSLGLEKTVNLQTSDLNSTSLRKQNHDWTYQTTMGDDNDVFFLVPKILGLHVPPLLSIWDLPVKVWPVTLLLKTNISGLLYASYLILLMNRNNIENY